MTDRRGATLIEIVVYIALLGVVLNLLTRLMGSAASTMKTLERRSESANWALHALGAFKNDVRAATSARLMRTGGAACPTLVLGQNASGETIRYEANGTTFVRRVTTGKEETARRVQLPAGNAKITVDGRCVTMMVQLPSGNRRAKKGCTLAATAAIRCPGQQEGKP